MIFVGPLYDPAIEKEILKYSCHGLSNASNQYQIDLLKGILDNKAELKVINALPVGAWPKHYKKFALADRNWEFEGAAARGAHSAGGRVIGVIPEALNLPKIAYPECDELIVTHDLRDRMAEMAERSDAFCVLPGGFGTLYELFEVITLNQLRYMLKPVVILNTNGYYDRMADLFEVMYREKCAREMCRRLYSLAQTPAEAMDVISAWTQPELTRWLTDVPEGELK